MTYRHIQAHEALDEAPTLEFHLSQIAMVKYVVKLALHGCRRKNDWQYEQASDEAKQFIDGHPNWTDMMSQQIRSAFTYTFLVKARHSFGILVFRMGWSCWSSPHVQSFNSLCDALRNGWYRWGRLTACWLWKFSEHVARLYYHNVDCFQRPSLITSDGGSCTQMAIQNLIRSSWSHTHAKKRQAGLSCDAFVSTYGHMKMSTCLSDFFCRKSQEWRWSILMRLRADGRMSVGQR